MRDPELQRRLIDATNLICEHVSKRLPQGWTLVMTLDGDEADLVLLDPSLNEFEITSPDEGRSLIDAACDDAIEADPLYHQCN